MRPRRSHPPHPWSGTGSSPSQICFVLGQLLRDEDVDLARNLTADLDTVRGMDALVARHKVGPYLKRRLEGSPVRQALTWIERLRPKRAILTHLHIDLDYEKLRRELPAHVVPAYDGMSVHFDWASA